MTRHFFVAFVLVAVFAGRAASQVDDTFYLEPGCPVVNANKLETLPKDSSTIWLSPHSLDNDPTWYLRTIKMIGTPPTEFEFHKREEDLERKIDPKLRQLFYDWVFNFKFELNGKVPDKLKVGDKLELTMTGKVSGGEKKSQSEYGFIRILSPGFEEKVLKGNAAIKRVAVGSGSSEGTLVTDNAERKVELTVNSREYRIAVYVQIGTNGDEMGNEVLRYAWEKKARPPAVELPLPPFTHDPPPPPPKTPQDPPTMAHKHISVGLDDRPLTACKEPIEAPRIPKQENYLCCIKVKDWCPDTDNMVILTVDAPPDIVVLPEHVIRRKPSYLENIENPNADTLNHAYCFRIGWRAARDAGTGPRAVRVTVSQEIPEGKTDCGGTDTTTFNLNVPNEGLQDRARFEPGRNGLSGPLKTFAGTYNTTLGPMTIRVEGERATGILTNLGLGFNAIVNGNLLLGQFRDAISIGGLAMELSDSQPMLHGLLVFDWAKERPSHGTAFSGTALQTGDPTRPVEPPQATSDKIIFQAPYRMVRPGDTFQVPIWMLNGKGISTLNLKLHYDPAVIQPVTSIDGNLSGVAAAEITLKTLHLPPGNALVGLFANQGLDTERVGTVTVMKFRAVGREGDKSPLKLEETTLTAGDADHPRTLSCELIDGVVYLAPPTKGTSTQTPPPVPPPPVAPTPRPPVDTPGPSGPHPPGPNPQGPHSPGPNPQGPHSPGPHSPGPGPHNPNTPPTVEPPAHPPAPPYVFSDALDALKMSVDKIEVNLNADVTGDADNSPDGKVTARDAQVIASRAAKGVRRTEQ